MSKLPKTEFHHETAPEIEHATLYGLLRLRSEVLVVEQQAPYLDLDGRDLDKTTWHLWATNGDDIVGCLRMLESDEAWRMGRLCTAHHARGRGIARSLVTQAIELAGDKVIETNTQTNLAPWHERFGFIATGPIFHEVGIPHTPMRRVPT